MKTTLEEILADVLFKHDCTLSKDEILEELREPSEHKEPWANVALEAMQEAVNAKLQEVKENMDRAKRNIKRIEDSNLDSPYKIGKKYAIDLAISEIEFQIKQQYIKN